MIEKKMNVPGQEIRRCAISPGDRWANGNIVRCYHLESAEWIWLDEQDLKSPQLAEFMLELSVDKEVTTRFHLSADQRYEFTLNGEVISRGPDRSDPAHWSFASYDVKLKAGKHLLKAFVLWLGRSAPAAQMDVAPGFIFSAEDLEQLANTGSAAWKVRMHGGIELLPGISGVYHVIGPGFQISGKQFFNEEDWRFPVIVRKQFWNYHGIIAPGARLHPSSLPDQLRTRFNTFSAVSSRSGSDEMRWVAAAQIQTEPWQMMLDGRGPVIIAPNSQVSCLIDLDQYLCGYPEIIISRGGGGAVRLEWAESLVDERFAASTAKGDRDVWQGKYFCGFGDCFLPDGPRRVFRSLWWRAGRYIQLSVKTGDEALVLENVQIEETRYPFVASSQFESSDDELNGIIPMMHRGLEACAHETFVDCPFYEQLSYVGDTRLQSLCWLNLSEDDRLIRRSLELFEWSRLGTGFVAERYPSEPYQLSVTFSMIWVLMLHDYGWWRDNPDFVKKCLPGMRALLDQILELRNNEGVLERLPGWSFIDWVDDWFEGYPPGAQTGVSATVDLFFLLALQAAAELEQEYGEPELEDRWIRLASAHAGAIRNVYWDEVQGLMKDSPDSEARSVHAQCLALLTGVLKGDEEERCFQLMLEDRHLAQPSVYFMFYLFEVLQRRGHCDLLYQKMDLWKSFQSLGLKTAPEKADPARSDCHGWGSHPLFHFRASLAGIRPAAAGFRRVRIEPDPGELEWIKTTIPHPKGTIELELYFSGDGVKGSVCIPYETTGEFHWRGKYVELEPGMETTISIEGLCS